MADLIVSKKVEAEESGKPQCNAFIPGIERFEDQAGVAISIIMGVVMIMLALVLNFITK